MDGKFWKYMTLYMAVCGIVGGIVASIIHGEGLSPVIVILFGLFTAMIGILLVRVAQLMSML